MSGQTHIMHDVSHRMHMRRNKTGKRLARNGKETNDAQENKEWQFVNLGQSGPTERAGLRKVVRANAMRYYRRSQKESMPLDGIEATPKASAHSSLVRQTRNDRFPWLKGDQHVWPNEWNQVLDEARSSCLKFGSGNLDPFEALPVKGNAQACELLHHCKPSANSQLL